MLMEWIGCCSSATNAIVTRLASSLSQNDPMSQVASSATWPALCVVKFIVIFAREGGKIPLLVSHLQGDEVEDIAL
jgi:hypothetical protein